MSKSTKAMPIEEKEEEAIMLDISPTLQGGLEGVLVVVDGVLLAKFDEELDKPGDEEADGEEE
jgi:hypothetical protein